MDKREIVARAIRAVHDTYMGDGFEYRMADAAIAALEPVTAQDEDKHIAAIWAHYGDLKSAKAALHALIENDGK